MQGDMIDIRSSSVHCSRPGRAQPRALSRSAARAAAYNAAAAPEAMARVARLLGAETAPEGLRALAASLGTPTALRDLGMHEDGIDRAADLAVADPYWNPRPLEREALRDLLADAHAGRWPLRA
jgi:alcohol dehydrogenase class IV